MNPPMAILTSYSIVSSHLYFLLLIKRLDVTVSEQVIDVVLANHVSKPYACDFILSHVPQSKISEQGNKKTPD